MKDITRQAVAVLLCFTWAAPLTVPSTVLLFIAWWSRQVELITYTDECILIWKVREDTILGRFYEGWLGNSLGNNIITWLDPTDGATYNRTIAHERDHTWWQYILGVLILIAYPLNSAFIWLFQKTRHSYYDNWFERRARKAAGQPLEIPKAQWRDGPGDRWAWW